MQTIGSLQVRRLGYVPDTAPSGGSGDYMRFLDLITNPTASPVMATVLINGNLGSDSLTTVTGSSSGDTTVTAADDWFSTDDSSPTGGDPPLCHLFHSPGAALSPTAVALSVDNPSWSYSVSIPAGATVGFLTFAVQTTTRADSISECRRLIDLPPDAFTGLDTYAASIQNFAVGGAPIVRFTAPGEIDEGAETLIEIMVEDLEMDPGVTWSWDTDDDGTFGEFTDMTMYTIPMGSTDGDDVIRIGVETSDMTGATRQVYRSITVNNVAPLITSSPPTTANVRREYTYTPTIDEPAGMLDPIRYILVSRPMGMDVDAATGTVTWTPTADQRARAFDVTLRVDDGDGGEDMQMWRIDVADNVPPEPPTPVSPIERMRVPVDTEVTLVAENGTDSDGDELVYFFRASQTSDFMGPDVIGSGELSEDPSGMTSWTTTEPLTEGLWYWEVWVDDGIVESFHRYAQVVVGDPDIPAEDGGPTGGDGSVGPGTDAGTGGGGGGGGCSTAPVNGTGSAWLLAIAALFFVRRRFGR